MEKGSSVLNHGRDASSCASEHEAGEQQQPPPQPKHRYSLFPNLEPSQATSGGVGHAHRSRLNTEMQATSNPDTTSSYTTAATLHTGPGASSSSSSSSPSPFPSVAPAHPIPARSSSSKAFINGDCRNSLYSASPGSIHSPPRHRRLISVPEERTKLSEVHEQEWMAQSKSQKLPHSPSFSTQVDALSPPTMISSDLINGTDSSWGVEKENILKGPFEYLESHPGKDIRSQMIAAFDAWLQVPQQSLTVITKVVQMLHTSSLLVDDVEDSSQLRRGIPVAHSIFGVAQTINSANYIYFLALQELMTLNNPEAVRIYTEELLNLHRGQGMDLFWRDTLTCPTEDDYLEMVGNKTGGLFRLAIKLMCAESLSYNRPESSVRIDYVPLVNTIGLLFQIVDDYKNLSDTVYTANKGLCEDLTEGKFSFPVIHAIRSDPSNLVLINILKQKTTDDEVKKYAVAYMERTGSFSYTRRVLRGLTKKALSLVDEVDAGRGRSEAIKVILERLRVDKHSRASASA